MPGPGLTPARDEGADAGGGGGGSARAWPGLPLFPLQTVLFPGGLLPLRVFEARYLDMVGDCLRRGAPFAVVCLNQGGEVRGSSDRPTRFETVGVLARLLDVDAEQPGILKLRCQGEGRVALAAPRQRTDGLWQADAARLDDDRPTAVPPAQRACAQALGRAIAALAEQEQHPFLPPHRLDDAGWVANRWCELLPIPLAAKQRLMVLDEPLLRLQIVDDYLRGKGVLA